MSSAPLAWRLCRVLVSHQAASSGSASQMHRCLSSASASTSGRGGASSSGGETSASSPGRAGVNPAAAHPMHPIFAAASALHLTRSGTDGLPLAASHSLLAQSAALHQARSYAAAAKGAAKAAAAGGAAAAPAGPKKLRRSSTRLFACRNVRFRHGFEQIFPTLKLRYERAQDFRRNSRIFVVDMGKAITLRNKYRLASSPGGGAGPVPHQQAQTLLHESDMHLDAVGEHPRYLKIRRLNRQYATKLQNVRKLRLLLGYRRRGYLQNLYEDSLMQPGPHRTWKLICAMEAQLNMFALRCGFAPDSYAMNGVMRRRRLAVNSAPPRYDMGTVVQPGDLISPALGRERFFRAYVAHGIRGKLHPDTRLAPLPGQSVYSSF